MGVDVWEDLLLEAAYGDVRIDVTTLQTTEGNDLVRHEFPRRDGVEIDHQGNRERVTSCTLLFLETVDRGARDFVRTGTDPLRNHIARYKAFRALAHDGKAHHFVHPIQGSYLARVEDFSTSAGADNRDWIEVTCSFVEVVEQQAVFDTVGIQKSAGVDAVEAAAFAAREVLDDLDETVDTTLPEASTALVNSWADRGPALSSREVNLELATFSKDFQDSLDELDLATDIDTYLPVRQLTFLHYQMTQAAETFVQKTSRIIDVTVQTATPLRVIAARVYGADQSDDRFDELVELNDIRKPGLIPAGTVLKAESPLQNLRTRSPR